MLDLVLSNTATMGRARESHKDNLQEEEQQKLLLKREEQPALTCIPGSLSGLGSRISLFLCPQQRGKDQQKHQSQPWQGHNAAQHGAGPQPEPH